MTSCLRASLLPLTVSVAFAAPLATYPAGNFAARVTVTSPLTPDSKPVPPAKPDPSGFAYLAGIDITRTDGIFLYHMRWSTGTGTDIWKDSESGLLVEQYPGGKVRVSRGKSLSLPALAAMDAASINWLTPDSAKGEAEYKGKKYLHYERLMVFPQENSKALYRAWIDPVTKFPALLDDGNHAYEITYSDDKPARSPENYDLPSALKDEYRRYEKEVKKPSYW